MQAMVIDAFGDASQLHPAERPEPRLAPDAILLRVHAAGVNPVDAGIRAGRLDTTLPHHFPLIPGWDAAGTVERVGPAVTAFAPGDEAMAYCRKDVVEEGAYAELVCVRATHAAPKPPTISFEEAGALPLAGLTAYQAICDVLGVQTGETLLVLGASGGVGSFAVQLGRLVGAHVVAVASAPHHEELERLGAAVALDYHDGDLDDLVRDVEPDGVDAALDLVGGDAQRAAVEALRPGGRLVSLVEPPDRAGLAERGLDARYHFVAPDGEDLRALSELAETGAVEVPVTATLALDEAAEAHRRIEGGHTRGKLVLRVP